VYRTKVERKLEHSGRNDGGPRGHPALKLARWKIAILYSKNHGLHSIFIGPHPKTLKSKVNDRMPRSFRGTGKQPLKRLKESREAFP
jgi:hypothetical protein